MTYFLNHAVGLYVGVAYRVAEKNKPLPNYKSVVEIVVMPANKVRCFRLIKVSYCVLSLGIKYSVCDRIYNVHYNVSARQLRYASNKVMISALFCNSSS